MKNSEMYYVAFKGRHVELRDYDKKLIRKYTMNADVVNAQVQGYGKECTVAIVVAGGKCFVYRSDGRLLRK